MKGDSTGFKDNDVRQGDVALGLSEYTSRKTRLKLVQILYDAFEEELKFRIGKRDPLIDRRLGASRVLARALGVTARTVQRWMSGGIQSCNVNAERLLQLSIKYAPARTHDVLEEDLEVHRFWIDYMIYNVRQPPVALQRGERVIA